METWLIFAISSLFCAGYTSFLLKVISKRNYNKNYVLFLRYIIGAVIAGIVYFYNYWGEIDLRFLYILLVIGIIKAIFSYYVTASKIEGLRNIDSVIFFPIYKVFSISFVTILSVILFSEYLSFKEIVGISIGILVPILLINKNENNSQLNLKLGIFYTILGAFLLSISAAINKLVVLYGFNVELFTFIWLSIGIPLSYSKYKKEKKLTLIQGSYTLFHSYYD